MAMTKDDYIQLGRNARLQGTAAPKLTAGSWQERAFNQGWGEAPASEIDIEPVMSPLSDFTVPETAPMSVREHIKHLLRVAEKEPFKAERMQGKARLLVKKWEGR